MTATGRCAALLALALLQYVVTAAECLDGDAASYDINGALVLDSVYGLPTALATLLALNERSRHGGTLVLTFLTVVCVVTIPLYLLGLVHLPQTVVALVVSARGASSAESHHRPQG